LLVLAVTLLSVLLAVTVLVAVWHKLLLPGRGPSEGQQADEPKMAEVLLAAEKVELFMEHPYLVRGKESKFNVHLTVLNDGMPIHGGKLTVVATGPSGKTVKVEQPGPRSPGIFGPVVAFAEDGQNQIVLTLQSDQAVEMFRVPVTVYPDEASAKKAAEEDKEPVPEGEIKFLKEQAWKVGLVLQPVGKRRLVERLTVPGQIVPPAGAKAVVTPPMSGRLLPPPQGAFPRVGQPVQAGQVVASIEPPLGGPQGVELLAKRAEIQTLETELAVKLLEVDVEIKKSQLALEQARRVFERAKSLSDQGANAKKQFEEAQYELRLAEATHEGKKQLRQPYEHSRRDLQAMLKTASSGHDSGVSADSASPTSLPGLQVAIKAPLSGTVTAAQATAGEFVDPSKQLFTIINLDRVWIEAKVSEYSLEQVTKAPAASFTLAAYPGRSITILGQNGGQLIDIGKVVEATSRTVPVRYEIANPEHFLRIGLFTDVAIETARAQEALAIPLSALVDDYGRPTVYVQTGGESFQKRDVELGIRDAGFVQVKQGLKEGERVAVKGAYTIRLASLSAVIPAHGHTH
jgi:multidrug efflux pump subunit AcrA (membrane-fusion protein)